MPIPTSEETEYTRHEARGKLFKLGDGRYAELCAGTLKIMANKQDKTAGRLGEMLRCRGVLQLADYLPVPLSYTCLYYFLHLLLPLNYHACSVIREAGTDIIMMEIRVDMLGKACLTGSDDRWITLETDDDYCDEEESWMFKVSGDLTHPLTLLTFLLGHRHVRRPAYLGCHLRLRRRQHLRTSQGRHRGAHDASAARGHCCVDASQP